MALVMLAMPFTVSDILTVELGMILTLIFRIGHVHIPIKSPYATL